MSGARDSRSYGSVLFLEKVRDEPVLRSRAFVLTMSFVVFMSIPVGLATGPDIYVNLADFTKPGTLGCKLVQLSSIIAFRIDKRPDIHAPSSPYSPSLSCHWFPVMSELVGKEISVAVFTAKIRLTSSLIENQPDHGRKPT